MSEKEKKVRPFTKKEKKALKNFKLGKPQILTREDMANSQLGMIVGMSKNKKDNLGLSPSEIREDKKRNKQKRGEKILNLSPSGKIKGERQSDLKRLEQIKKNQAAEDAAKKKKAKGKGPKLGGEFTGPRKNVLKRMNMGGVMKARGGTFKGTY